MATITSLAGADIISTADSMATINTNFDNLNSDKIETSYLDTDTAMAADSDTKIPSQKAVKTYIDTQGGANASETVRGIVEEATDAEVTAGTATGGTGAKLIVTPAKLATRLGTILPSPLTVALGGTALTAQSQVYGSGVIARDMTAASGAVTTAHGLGIVPKRIKLTAFVGSTSTSAAVHCSSTGTYDGTTNKSITIISKVGDAAEFVNSTTYILQLGSAIGGGTSQVAVATFDATNITLTWTKNSTPTSTAEILWEAWGF